MEYSQILLLVKWGTPWNAVKQGLANQSTKHQGHSLCKHPPPQEEASKVVGQARLSTTPRRGHWGFAPAHTFLTSWTSPVRQIESQIKGAFFSLFFWSTWWPGLLLGIPGCPMPFHEPPLMAPRLGGWNMGCMESGCILHTQDCDGRSCHSLGHGLAHQACCLLVGCLQ